MADARRRPRRRLRSGKIWTRLLLLRKPKVVTQHQRCRRKASQQLGEGEGERVEAINSEYALMPTVAKPVPRAIG